MKRSFQLPEKEYFSVAEIAEQWKCDVPLVEHYVYENRILRPALITKQLRFPVIMKEKLSRLDVIRSRGLSKLDCYEPEDIFGWALPNGVIELPRFLYVEPLRHIDPWGAWVPCFENFEGKEYFFIAIMSHLPRPPETEFKNLFCMARTPKDAKAACVITKEERDRFESKYSSSPSEFSDGDSKHEDTADRHNHAPELQALSFESEELEWTKLSPSETTADFAKLCYEVANSLRRVPGREELVRELVKRFGGSHNIQASDRTSESLYYGGKVYSHDALNQVRYRIIDLLKKAQKDS